MAFYLDFKIILWLLCNLILVASLFPVKRSISLLSVLVSVLFMIIFTCFSVYLLSDLKAHFSFFKSDISVTIEGNPLLIISPYSEKLAAVLFILCNSTKN
jgi:hypothetical protein